MYERRVGRKYAQFYVCWSSLADKKLGASAAKAIIKKVGAVYIIVIKVIM
jgi:hypothetical protein